MFQFPGQRTEGDENDVVTLLLECHQRIRHFADLARRLGEAGDLPEEEVREAAQAVRRYFTEALPLHVADEEESVTPELRGQEPEVDAALEQMTAEHRDHEPLLANLVATCEALAEEPSRHAEMRDGLAKMAEALGEQFEVHLRAEEAVIIPALRRLCTRDARARMAEAVRARRREAWHN